MVQKITLTPVTTLPKLNQPVVPAGSQPGFGELLARAIDTVNTEQVKADVTIQKFLTGEIQDVHQVMIAGQQARLTMQLALEVRNKVVEAYQEISRIPV
ncbi:MAG: flagellar hook-basal body complex protein FliE [Desulforudis sp.]|jgi:flagellar hook-basal body complex protein FliE|nr:flagellar hook-basal body complex protein FliE [Clostridia bacterium]MDQ7792519.1 flagellar hook-basal body complex protein FliE [Clostridia bacterium]RJX22392.1 MAG: flagellar hook-basal body complex protein FliE [Desulforudis sp.]